VIRSHPLVLLTLLSATTASVAENPILRGADPHAEIIDKQVWIYPTGGGRSTQFFTWSSKDFKKWEKHGPILDLNDAPWVKEDGAPRHGAWAPCIIRAGTKYYFYYSVGPQNPTPSRIGVATGDSPAGPFVDSGKPLLTGGNGFEAIDPFVFKDPKSGKHFFYAGGSAGAKLRVFELNADMVSFAREIEVETPRNFTEGAFVHVHKGKYYLSYSHGSYRDHSYSVHYSTSQSPTGPWTYGGAILTSDKRHKGPGHHSLIYLPGTSQWLIVYHRWNDRTGNGPYNGSRETCIDRLEHAPDGSIRPVVMTDRGYQP
jgi:beta-xylosidase